MSGGRSAGLQSGEAMKHPGKIQAGSDFAQPLKIHRLDEEHLRTQPAGFGKILARFRTSQHDAGYRTGPRIRLAPGLRPVQNGNTIWPASWFLIRFWQRRRQQNPINDFNPWVWFPGPLPLSSRCAARWFGAQKSESRNFTPRFPASLTSFISAWRDGSFAINLCSVICVR